ncbi:MAG TPA: DUF3187 family protein [Dokdonella sp.]
MPDRRRRRRGARLVGLAFALLGADAAAAESPWLLYRDANPFVAASGLPFAPPAAPTERDWRVEAFAGASNTELAFDRGGEHLVYDAEIHEARVALTRALGTRWLVRATFGAEHVGSGFLDGLVEDYHRTFGFDAGDRGRLGTDGHTIAYRDARGDAVALDRSLTAPAPLLLDVALRAPAEHAEWLYGATLKLPISHASPLVDDRALDLSVWLAVQSVDAQSPWSWGARAGVMQRGRSRLLRGRDEDQVPFADAALTRTLGRSWDLQAQLQWHRALYDSAIPLLESAATLSLSSGWHARGGWTLRAGLVEDATARRAQDVTLFVALSI